MIQEKDQISFIRNYLISDDIDFFLGSGASLLAGIPSGQNLVWQFKKEIYCFICFCYLRIASCRLFLCGFF